MDRWLETIGQHTPATRRLYLSRVRCFLAWMLQEGAISNNPTGHVAKIVQPRSVPVVFKLTESTALFDHVRGDLRATAILETMFGGAARCVEVSRLRVEDYDPHKGIAMFTGKGRHQRLVPVTSSMAAAWDAYLDSVGRKAGPFFRSRRNPNAGLSPETISIYFQNWSKAAGVKARPWDGRSAHGARRTAGNLVVDETGDIRHPQALLGHEHIETTAKHYTLPIPLDELRGAMENCVYRADQPRAA